MLHELSEGPIALKNIEDCRSSYFGISWMHFIGYCENFRCGVQTEKRWEFGILAYGRSAWGVYQNVIRLCALGLDIGIASRENH